MIAAETLAAIQGRPHRGPSIFDSVGSPVLEIDLGDSNVDTVTLTGNGHEHTLVIPPRPPGSTYVSLDPGTGAITTVVAGWVVYRGPPDPGMRKLFEVGRADGMTRQAGRRR